MSMIDGFACNKSELACWVDVVCATFDVDKGRAICILGQCKWSVPPLSVTIRFDEEKSPSESSDRRN